MGRARDRARRAERASSRRTASGIPSTCRPSAQATIGGMTANNSCGARSMRYGNMVHNVLAAETWLSTRRDRHVRRGRRERIGRSEPRLRDRGAALSRARRDRARAARARARRDRARCAEGAAARRRLQPRHGFGRRVQHGAACWSARKARSPTSAGSSSSCRRCRRTKRSAIVPLPDVLSGDGAHAAHRQARPAARRARRPHDDRAVARNRDVPRDGRQDDPRRRRTRSCWSSSRATT